MSNLYHNFYPRPCLKRDSFLPLTKGEIVFSDGSRQSINLPFSPESSLSGVEAEFGRIREYKYEIPFTLPNSFIKDRVLLHIGAVRQKARIYINGKVALKEHIGAYSPIDLDITKYLKEENLLTVEVYCDTLDYSIPSGKQRGKRGGMWYTDISGIWQSVWLESVTDKYIKDIKIKTTLNSAEITFTGVNKGTVECQGKIINVDGRKCKIKIENPINWTPETPHLYPFTATFGEDKVESYFALRTIEVKGNELLLNKKPYFFHGVLDQGYFEKGILTPTSPEDYKDDIFKMKSLGFNMIRKHIKVEPQIFYYYCDKYGMAVFQDMVNNGKYSFFFDTVLPTIFLKRKNDKLSHRDPVAQSNFLEGMKDTVKNLYNHPSIVEWTIFNEGWGQFRADEIYTLLTRYDQSRPIDTASGWFKTNNTDFDSKHIYFRKLKAKKTDKPLFLSEFGGITHKVEGHTFGDKTYGYGSAKTREDFKKALCDLYENQVIPLKKEGLCASVYTQLSDVEDEINGLITYDRTVMKILPEEFKDISERLKNEE